MLETKILEKFEGIQRGIIALSLSDYLGRQQKGTG